jgi:hypothetical protein
MCREDRKSEVRGKKGKEGHARKRVVYKHKLQKEKKKKITRWSDI